MSCTSLWCVYKTRVTSYAEYRNGFGSGPALWDFICVKYLGRPFDWMKTDSDLWALANSDKLPMSHRVPMMLTYDNPHPMFVEVAHLRDAASACEQAHADILNETRVKWDWSHWNAIASDMRAIHDRHDHRLLGVGVGCTSVYDPWEYFDEHKAAVGSMGIYETCASMEAA